ncbi:contractile injection system tape measure protein [Roseateles sp.]|uniref:contractile injection system tape measure protein n=1 Tax=Roseateles sp. TaxID=1971397 RepID=UPI003D09DDDF
MNHSHRIETLSWEARFSHARLAHAQQDRLSEFIHKHALPRMAERFDALSPPGEVWALERLEVDIGRLRIQDSPSQWLRQFDLALQRSLARLSEQIPPRAALAPWADSSLDSEPTRRLSSAGHELGQFLHFLQHGLLPWGMPLRSARDLAGWLERLALHHGPRLWQALQQLMPPEPVLARLSLIAPHAGLQALLSVRHRELAEAMLLLDDNWLLPLQRRGRLSAYQVQSLQQRLRVAGLHALWGLSGGALGGARQRRLLAALQASHAELLGPGWMSLRRALRGQVLPRPAGSELAAAMLAALLGAPDQADAQTQADADSVDSASGPGRPPSRLGLAALRRMQEQVQAWATGRPSAGSSAHIGRSLAELHRLAPAALRQALLEQLRPRSGRRAWSLALPVEHSWPLLALLAGPTGAIRPTSRPRADEALAGPEPLTRPAPPQWADSLRQTALQLLKACPAAERPGLSAMQSLLMEASLAHLLEHGRLPATHSAWLSLWQGAWARWQGSGDADTPAPQARDRFKRAAGPALQAAASLPLASDGPNSTTPLSRLQALPWLPTLIARWQAPKTQPSDEAAAPPWPAAALRRWLWQEAEALSAAASPQATVAPIQPASLEAHWRRRWQQLHDSCLQTNAAKEAAATAHSKPGLENQLQQLWLQCQSKAYGTAQRLRLAELLEQPAACQQWCAQFEPAQRWQWLAAQFGSGAATSLKDCMATMRTEAAAPAPELARDAVPAMAPSATAAPAAEPLWPLLCEHLFVLAGAPNAAGFRRHVQEASRAAPEQQRTQRPSEALPALHPDHAGQAGAANKTQSSSAPATSTKATTPAPVRPAPPARPAPATAPPGPLAAPIWVEDAGQVLLAAYAERLFKHLGLTEGGQFVDAPAQARAVLCLQALVRGDAPSSEPLWPLSKLLCGLAPTDLLPACDPLTAQERALLNDLLTAVISHWKAIGNTSVAGLRESFLQREGRLERQRAEHGEPAPWRLKVQPRAFDMLLDRLPWGFSIIKLPWMQGVLHVEWR